MSKPKKRSKALIIVLLAAFIFSLSIFSLPVPAVASEEEYYVYNGFDAVSSAFQKIALIFSSKDYKALYFSVIVFGILFGGIAVMVKAAAGGRYSPFAWAVPVGIGVTIFLALIIPKGTIHLYDPVKNRYQAIGDLPEGVVVLAGILNKVERGLIDLVSESEEPMSYQDQAGGIGFDIFYNLGTRGITLANKNLTNNLKRYIRDCVFFELARPGTTLNANDFMNNTDYMSLFGEAVNPSVFTVYYSDTKPEGETCSCTVAWANISTDLNNQATFESTTKETCANIGFDPTVPAEYNRCQEIMTNTISYLWGASYDITQVTRQVAITEAINDTVIGASPDTVASLIASRDTGTAWLSGGMMANEFVPVLRAVLTAIMLGLIPFFALLIPTPIVGKVLPLLAGSFVWLTSWGVTDAIVHQFAIDYAKKAYYEVANNGLGMMAVNSFATASMKTLAVFAGMRWAGLMLASVLTGMIIKFGGYALASMAGHITGSVTSAAAGAGSVAVKPEVGGQTLNALETSQAPYANAHAFGFEGRARIAAANRMGYTQRDTGIVEQHGFGGLKNIVGTTGQFGMERNYAAIGAMGGVENASHIGGMEGTQTLGSVGRTGGAIEQAGGVDGFIKMMRSKGNYEVAEFMETAKGMGKELGVDINTQEGLTQAMVKTAETRADLVTGDMITEMRNQGLSGQANMLEYRIAKQMGKGTDLGPLADSSAMKQMLGKSGIKGSRIDDGWFITNLVRDNNGNIVSYVARSQDGRSLEKFEGGVFTSRTGFDSQAGSFELEQRMTKEGNIIDTQQRGLAREGTTLGIVDGKKLVAGKGTQVEVHGKQITFTGNLQHGDRTFYGRVYGNLSEPVNMDNAPQVMNTMAEKGSGIIFTNIDRGIGKQDGTFIKTGRQEIDYDEKTKVEGRGTIYKFGDDIKKMIIDYDDVSSKDFYNKYGGYFRGVSPQDGGRALVDKMANDLGGYGKIAQQVQDIAKAEWEAGGDVSKVLGVFGIKGGASIGGGRRAIESIDAETIKIAMQNRYKDIMHQQDWTTEKKSDFMLKNANDIYQLLNENATKGTMGQMTTDVKNPAKGDGVSEMPGNEIPKIQVHMIDGPDIEIPEHQPAVREPAGKHVEPQTVRTSENNNTRIAEETSSIADKQANRDENIAQTQEPQSSSQSTRKHRTKKSTDNSYIESLQQSLKKETLAANTEGKSSSKYPELDEGIIPKKYKN